MIQNIKRLRGLFIMDTSKNDARFVEEGQTGGGKELAGQVARNCFDFLRPLLVQLDRQLDLRLVRTMANTVIAVVRHRNRPVALLLSELGAYLADPEHAPAGTKRLANLLRSRQWRAEVVEDYLLACGAARVREEAGSVKEGRALCILDGSVLEKPESSQAEGLSPVISSKARRLSRPRPKLGKGYFAGKPGGPVVVPGFQWVAAMVTGWSAQGQHRPVTLGAWHWYSKPPSSDQPPYIPVDSPVVRQRHQEAAAYVLDRVVDAWGAERLLHVWDRGLSGASWLGWAMDQGWHFVVRWKKANKLRPADAPSVGDPGPSDYRREQESVAAWRLTAGLRALGHELVANPRKPKEPITVSFAAREVYLMHRDDPLWLVVVRVGKGTKRRRGASEPWRLLTTEPVRTRDECWRIVQAYVARWQIEQMLRYGKSELGIESIRVRRWEPRNKLLALVGLAYAFLVHLLGDGLDPILDPLLHWAHRTGRQAHGTYRSLYRLRSALAALWQKHTPIFQGVP